jgi:hypothetical protein
MMMPILGVYVIVAAVSPPFGLKGRLDVNEVRSKAMEHLFDDVVGPNAKKVATNFSGQMPISEMPRQADELMGIFVSDFHNRLRGSLNLQPGAVVELQAIAIGHGNRFRKVNKDIFSVVRS